MIEELLYNRKVEPEYVDLGNQFYNVRTSHLLTLRETAYKLNTDVLEVQRAEQGLLDKECLEELIIALKHTCRVR